MSTRFPHQYNSLNNTAGVKLEDIKYLKCSALGLVDNIHWVSSSAFVLCFSVYFNVQTNSDTWGQVAGDEAEGRFCNGSK